MAGVTLTDYLQLLDAFVRACECDQLLASLTSSGGCVEHGDGWGYVLLGFFKRGSVLTDHYRTTVPVFKDPAGLVRLRDAVSAVDAGVLLVHARKAAEGSVSVKNTHPIHYGWRGYDMWIAHNGVVDSERLATALNILRLPDLSDTYYLGEYVYRRLEKLDIHNVSSVFGDASGYTKTAMNAITLHYSGSTHAVITSYLTEERLRDSRARDYYRLYLIQQNGVLAVSSSTVVKYLPNTVVEVKELPLQAGLLVALDSWGSVTELKSFSLS